MNDEQLRQPSDTPGTQTEQDENELASESDNLNGTAASTGQAIVEGSAGSTGTDVAPLQAAADAEGNGNGAPTPAGETSQPTLEDATESGMAAGPIDAQDAETAGAVDTAGMAPEAAAPVADLPLQTDSVGAVGSAGSVSAPADTETPQSAIATPQSEEPAGTSTIVEEPAVAEAITPFHPSAPTGGTAEQADAEEVLADAGAVAGADAGADVGADVGAVAEGEAEAPEEEAPVVRTARDPRLTEMAPNASMEDLLRASEQQYRTLKHGDVIEGTVMKVDREEILVDIGAKSEGIVPSHELQSLSDEERQTLKPGDGLLVSVVQPENAEGHAILSLDRARQEKSWRDLQKQFEAGEIIQAPVSGYNKGGLLVNLAGVRGFVPSSQVSSISGAEANKQSEMARLQGQSISLKIIEINRNRNRLILSERQAVQEQRESVRSRLLRELEPGQTIEGRVSSICDFGAFVDVGGADGLIHLSELSWKRVSHPREVLSVGDRINVYVLSVDRNERKIALSLKRTQPEPWSTITENYHLGQIVRGTITQLTSFGAFARLEDGIEGLIHVSELAEGRVAHPSKVVNVGDQLELKVIRIDPAKRRIGLSLKRMNEDIEAEAQVGGPVDEETAAEASAPSAVAEPGAFGVEEVAPSSQVTETTVEAPAARVRAETRPEPRPEPAPARPPRRAQERQERQERRQPADQMPDDEEPMGALAAALAAHTRQLAAAEEADAEEEVAEVAEVAEPEAEAEVEVEAEAEPEAEVEEEAEAEAEPVAEEEAEPAGAEEVAEEAAAEVETEEEPEAAMPASSDVEAADEAEAGEEGTTAEEAGVETAGADEAVEAGEAEASVETEPEPETEAGEEEAAEEGEAAEADAPDEETTAPSDEEAEAAEETDTDEGKPKKKKS